MKQWTGGYVADIDYTHGYYRELNPLHAAMALAHAGLAMPAVGAACELGFGQGLSVNLHAAAGSARWHGTDFNPTQAGFAAQLAQAAGSGALLLDQSFSEYCQRDDLPDFDFIGLHGVWSWVSGDNRRQLLAFIQRKLKPGGVLYVSHNSHPGWAPMAPLRDLLAQYIDSMTAPGDGMERRIDAALAFAGRLLATNPAYLQAYPLLAERIAALQTQDRRYLAHEYFNQHWQPLRFADMAAQLAQADVDIGCPAHHLDQIALFNLDAAQRALLADLPDPALAEGVRDLMVNQSFRRDYWVKGARQLSAVQQEQAMARQRVVLVAPRSEAELHVKTSMLDITLNTALYGPLLDLLADHQPRSVAELAAALPMRGGLQQVFEAVFILCGNGTLAPAATPEACAAAREPARRLNLALLERARYSEAINYLASPVVGGGLPMPRIPQLFLLAQSQGRRGTEAWSAFTWDVLAAQGQQLSKNGQLLTSAADNLAELQRKADIFERQYLPMYRTLRVAD
ncbi:MAG: class I SAM-dependent methyltransferase [Duganella sp.]